MYIHEHVKTGRKKDNTTKKKSEGVYLLRILANDGSRNGKTKRMHHEISHKVGKQEASAKIHKKNKTTFEKQLFSGRGESLPQVRTHRGTAVVRTNGDIPTNAPNTPSEYGKRSVAQRMQGHLRPRLVERGIADAVEPVREARYPGLVPVAQQPSPARVGEHKVEAGVPPSLLLSSDDQGTYVKSRQVTSRWEGIGRSGGRGGRDQSCESEPSVHLSSCRLFVQAAAGTRHIKRPEGLHFRLEMVEAKGYN